MSDDHSAAAVIVYTSGTTGDPKGVVLSNDSINALAHQDQNGLIDFKRGETCLLILPPFIGFGIAHIQILLSAGIISILQINLDPNEICKSLFRYNPYCFISGPALVEPLLSHPIGNLDNLRYFFGGGGSITKQQEETINQYLKQCGSSAFYANGYGMTEAASILSINLWGIRKAGSLGFPLIKTVVKVVDTDTEEELPYGKVGELLFSTPALMEGYLNEEESTDAVLVKDQNGGIWLRTGDLGYVDEDGFIFLKGRIKRIYITMGSDNNAYKLFPQRIEETVEENIGNVEKCAVVVKPDDIKMNIAIAFVSLKNKEIDSIETVKTIQHQLTDILPEFMLPQEIIVVDSMPVTPSGKIDYRKLEEMTKREKE